MAVVANKRSVMTLFSRSLDPDSHRVRIVLAEKGINVDIRSLDTDELPQDLMDLNPYGSVPTLVDRELVLYDPKIIMEYLDERFPHPPLMPVDPVSRARYRLALHRVESDWYSILDELESSGDKKAARIRKQFREQLIAANDVFASMPYFLSEEFSLVDCTIAPILWRLPKYGIQLGKDAPDVEAYAERIFQREGFRASLTEIELELRLL